jgi:RNA polymerase sigma-70 factor (ECF subfamily)
MAALMARAGAAWSRLAPPRAEFARWLEERGAPTEELHVEDLYLLFAALHGERLAMAHLEREVFPVLGRSLRRVGLSDDEQVEVLQRLRVRLFTPTEKSPPRAHEYSGKGPLGAWLRVVATRLGLDLQREKGARAREREEQDASMANVLSPEAAALKHRYGAAFQKALTASVVELEPEVVNLLRLVAVDGLQTAQLARLFRLDRATVKRRVAAARKRVVESTRARLGLSPSEFRSLAALVQSQLHLSFGPAPRS